MTNPIFAYGHADAAARSITGGAFVPDGAWPGYDGTYLYADFVCGKIFTLSADLRLVDAVDVRLRRSAA